MKGHHEHPLTLINGGGALLCPADDCPLCNENLSGSCYGCELCWPQQPKVHQSCWDLPEEIRFTNRPECLLLYQERESFDCKFCNRDDGRDFCYSCGDCDYVICFRCTSKLIKYHEGQEHVEHFSHRHPLTLLKLDDMMTCKFCNVNISDGPAYGCAPCKFYLHNSCRDEILPEIGRHSFHPQHSLLSLHDYFKDLKLCVACGSRMEGLGYRCDACDFHLHPQCKSLKPTKKYRGHPHLLILVENSSCEIKCEECGFDIIKGVLFMRCWECRINFHMLCDPHYPRPPTVLRKEDEHPLIHNDEALANKDDSQPLIYCNVCWKELYPEEQFYQCAESNYFTHVGCAITEVKYDDDEAKVKHCSHEHILTVRHTTWYDHINCCGCEKKIVGSAYDCDPCMFTLHKSCAEMPRQIYDHPSHEHYLTLQSPDRYSFYGSTCSICHASGRRSFMYRCDPCEFEMDLECASLHPSINQILHSDDESKGPDEVGERIGHFSHRHHLVILEEAGVSCKLCLKNINGQCYGCPECKFFIHISCSALKTEIWHPFHPHHSLKLFVNEKSGYWCDACCFYIKSWRYGCDECKFNLHPECISLKPNIEYKGHQQHLLTLVEDMSFPRHCEACGLTSPDTLIMRCVECNLYFHVQCPTDPQPPTILHKGRGHRLTLIRAKKLVEDNSDQPYCIVCRKEWNQEHIAYYCAEFNYYAHVHCLTEVQLEEPVYEGEKLEHFSHRHCLFALENKRNDDDRICCACEENIQANPAYYGCEACKFYLHKSCVNLQREIQHPFHQHPLMLPSPYSGEYHQCNSCLKHYDGFSYQCQVEGCYFNLDVNCSFLLPSLKLESLHKDHTLHFFKKLYEAPECDHCEFIPPSKITPLDAFYFRCVACNFSRHLLCCPLPETIEIEGHHHSLTLRNNFVDLFDGFDDEEYCCDSCETRRDARESVYHCEACNFVIDIECVFSKVMQFLEGKLESVQGRIVSREIVKNVKASYKYVMESLTEEEKKFMESFMEIQKDSLQLIFEELKDISLLANSRISDTLSRMDDQLLLQIMTWEGKELESINEELVDVGDYKICRKVAPVLRNLLLRFGDIGVGCQFPQRLKTITVTKLCFVIEHMSEITVTEIENETIIFWWYQLKLAERAGFRIDFALDHMKRKVEVHFLMDDQSTIKSSPLYDIHKNIAKRFNRIEGERKEIEILKEKATKAVSAHGSERLRSEAERLNETLKLSWNYMASGLLDDI